MPTSPRLNWPYPKELLQELYDAGKSLKQIAELAGKPISTVRYRMVKEGVKLRDPVQIQKGRRKVGVETVAALYLSGLSAEQVAKRVGVSKRLVLLRLQEGGVDRREPDRSWEAEALRLYGAGDKVGDVARKLGVPKGTVSKFIWQSGVGRTTASYLVHQVGSKNPNWRGGVSFHPYPPEFNNQLKDRIRRRDGYCCRECGLAEADHRIRYPSPYNGMGGQNLSVHHIDYDKGNCSESNLIALCQACNARANGRRAYWTTHFQEMLKEAV